MDAADALEANDDDDGPVPAPPESPSNRHTRGSQPSTTESTSTPSLQAEQKDEEEALATAAGKSVDQWKKMTPEEQEETLAAVAASPQAQKDTQIFKAAESGKPASVGYLLSIGASPDAVSEWGYNALHAACHGGMAPTAGHTECVKLLIDAGASINSRMSEGWSALCFCGRSGHLGAAEALLKAGADTTIRPGYGSGGGMTALDLAQKFKRDDVVALLSK